MARQLFGTDGIRGVAGQYPLDAKTVTAVGGALGKWIRDSGRQPAAVIGTDTRESGPWLAAAVANGLSGEGVQVRYAGVTTTPGVAFLAKNGAFSAGVMISASHNPYQDNGVKILGHEGFKLPDEREEQLETEIFARLRSNGSSPSIDAAELTADSSLDRLYADHLASTMKTTLSGMTIVADCANGSATEIGPALFEKLGAKVIRIGASPNGRNINLDCGSLHLEGLRTKVRETGADAGVAFDGDADRALFVSGSGKIVDGDAVMLVTARKLHSEGRLRDKDGQPVVVATVMSNLGLERALTTDGIRLVRTPVGDKYVLEEMLRIGATLGGEQSGHVIFLDYATTGDGLLTALRVFEAMRDSGQNLDELTRDLHIYPQTLVNVRVKDRKKLEDLPAVNKEIRAAEASFGAAGRVLVRFSGTEPLARVMVEGPDEDSVETFANRIAASIKTELG